MEKSCYKCGQVMEEGRPFCPHCAAPQIRVLIAEPLPATPMAEAAALPQASAAGLPASATVPVLAVPMQWSRAFKPCTLAAAVASLLMLLGLNPFVGMLSVGFLAVIFYRQGSPGASIRPGTGARLGALSGLLCFAMASIIEALRVLVLHQGAEIRQALLTAVNQAAARTSDPQALAVFERFKSPDGLEFLMIFGLLFGLVAAIVLAAISGAVGGAVLGKPRTKM
jgi:hypothetical protein